MRINYTEPRPRPRAANRKEKEKLRNSKIEKAAVAALEDIKARDITVLDTRPLTAMYDSIIVATAESARRKGPSSEGTCRKNETDQASRR